MLALIARPGLPLSMCSTVIFPTAPSLLAKIQCKYFRLCSRVSWRAVFNRLKASLQASKTMHVRCENFESYGNLNDVGGRGREGVLD